ncbi:MAG TPA: adenylate/guanylate cyclase domain-containing protein [Alphaproteobacteria bacterium]|jgi:adenylate cyclase
MARHTAPDAPNLLIDNVTDWLMGEALGEPAIEHLVEGTAARVDAAGIPIHRFHISFNMLHPLYSGMGLTWRRGKTLEVARFERTTGPDNPAWTNSPLNHMIQRRITSLRRRLVGREAILDFPVLEELRAAGATDYFAFAIPFASGDEDGLIGSWTTDRKRGFFDADLRALHRIQRRLAVACRMTIRGQVAKNVVATYLGRGAGERVLAGQIRRGEGETIPAVIWYSDLRGSTAMAERLDRESYTEILNCYFECVGGAILKEGGEILDFIGDAILAIFPIHGDTARRSEACARAYAAALDAQRRIDHTNAARAAEDMPQLSYGLALHVGDVMFGNIGTPERLSFSVIGPSVNKVARLEALTKEVGRPIVASRDYIESCPVAWELLGQFKVQGIAEPIELFAPRAETAAAVSATADTAAQRRPEGARSKSPMAKAQ